MNKLETNLEMKFVLGGKKQYKNYYKNRALRRKNPSIKQIRDGKPVNETNNVQN